MNNSPYVEGEGRFRTGGFILGLLTGMVIGGVATMLYTPKSGVEVRAQLKEEFNRVQQMIEEWANDIKVRADEFKQIISFKAEAGQTTGDGQTREY